MSKYLDSGGLSYLWSKIKSLFENKSNKVTSITETSTDEQYPSAKAVFDLIGSGGGLGDLKIDYGVLLVDDLTRSINKQIHFNIEFSNPPCVIVCAVCTNPSTISAALSSVHSVTTTSFYGYVVINPNVTGNRLGGMYWIAIGT